MAMSVKKRKLVNLSRTVNLTVAG